MESTRSANRVGPKLVFGILLMAAGLSSLLERLGVIDHFDLGRWWPLILVAIGAGKLTGQAPDRQQGWFFLGMGAWFLIITTTAVSFGDTWPVLLLLWGVSTIWSGLRKQDVARGGDAAVDSIARADEASRENSHVN